MIEYRRFAARGEELCAGFERRLREARRRSKDLSYRDLEELAVHYRQLLHDHALARARFPGTAVAQRLERLVLEGTHLLQRDAGDHLPSPRRFLGQSFPDAVRRLLPTILLTAALFVVAGLFGFALTSVEPGMASIFLAPEAVDGLAAGRLWTEPIFAVTPGSVASTRIATNNLSVAISGWAGGALAGLGAFYVVLLNGLMLGAVLATTAHYSMMTPLLDFIAAHGPLELTLIVVTAGAGLEVGRALVVAGDRPRGERLRRAGRDALIVLLGCLPWILALGFVEGFVSPRPEISLGRKVLLGLLFEGAFVLVAWNPLRRPGGVAAAVVGAATEATR
jgi:uncharacterized membrane protein SpoIIM required for sporulation